MDDDSEKRGKLRSLAGRLPTRGAVEEDIPEGRHQRVTWPIAFIIATLIVCLTTVYIMSKWAEWDCKWSGKQWVGSDGIEPDNFCIEQP
jgi:hypothetical protein